jgi:LPXTG-motif cell wall-anchored protein
VQSGNSGTNRTAAAKQIFTGDTANIKHLVLLGILSLLILVIAIPKKKKDDEEEKEEKEQE